jgi:hypothetical protein
MDKSPPPEQVKKKTDKKADRSGSTMLVRRVAQSPHKPDQKPWRSTGAAARTGPT